MAMTVIEVGAISDERLPLGQLAAQMRLADGVIGDPEQGLRLRSRLRAAIDLAERRLGKILLLRDVILDGPVEGGRRIRLPVAPVAGIVDAAVIRGGIETPLGAVSIEAAGEGAVAVLSVPVGVDETVRMTVTAGFGDWAAIPEGVAQAVLLIAEALDAGEGPALVPMAETLLAPYRAVRIGRVGR